MARKKKGWSPKQGKWRKEGLKEAIRQIKSGKMTKFKASKLYKIPRTTLSRRLVSMDIDAPAAKPTVLTHKEEESLVAHILKMEERGCGLTIIDIRKLAYEIVFRSGRKHCFNNETKRAGYDWWQGFRERHPCLSIRKPEGLSAARSTMLNPNVISAYFDKLGKLMQKLNIKDKPQQIFNADETGLSTVHDSSKIVGKKGKKNVHSKTSGERGESVTALCCVNAEARVLAPMLIFKGQRISQSLMANAPANTLFACSKTAFIYAELFSSWFEKIFMPNLPPQRPVLLILDGHSSHITVPLLDTALVNGIEVFCLPPHTTHWTQPLDRSIFGPMKKAYNQSCEMFMKKNPGRVVTRYDVCGLFKHAFNEKMNMVNIFSGFRATGIYPFNPNAIPVEAFGPSKTSVCIDVEEEVATTEPVNEGDQPGLSKTNMVHQSNSALSTSEGRQAAIQEPDNLKEPENIPSTSESNYMQDILKTPKVIKNKMLSKKKSKRITEARCLTEIEFVKELRRKEEEKTKMQEEKENRKKEREEKKREKELEQIKRKLAKSINKKGTKKGKQKRLKNNKENESTLPVEQSDSFCALCNGNYFDDDSDDEDWVKCIRCDDWYHESCTGKYGRELAEFICDKH